MIRCAGGMLANDHEPASRHAAALRVLHQLAQKLAASRGEQMVNRLDYNFGADENLTLSVPDRNRGPPAQVSGGHAGVGADDLANVTWAGMLSAKHWAGMFRGAGRRKNQGCQRQRGA